MIDKPPAKLNPTAQIVLIACAVAGMTVAGTIGRQLGYTGALWGGLFGALGGGLGALIAFPIIALLKPKQ